MHSCKFSKRITHKILSIKVNLFEMEETFSMVGFAYITSLN